MSSDAPDKHGHFKMSRATAPGDSGGGVFDFYSGKLLGMMVGVEHYSYELGRYSNRGHVVPIKEIMIFFYKSQLNQENS